MLLRLSVTILSFVYILFYIIKINCVSFLELESRSDRRDCLRLLCMLLPQANRDTLQQLLYFLDQVAMYSSEIILIDGTESMGNRMTEENLALIFGPNILHKVNCFCCSQRLLVGQVVPHSHIGKTYNTEVLLC